MLECLNVFLMHNIQKSRTYVATESYTSFQLSEHMVILTSKKYVLILNRVKDGGAVEHGCKFRA